MYEVKNQFLHPSATPSLETNKESRKNVKKTKCSRRSVDMVPPT